MLAWLTVYVGVRLRITGSVGAAGPLVMFHMAEQPAVPPASVQPTHV